MKKIQLYLDNEEADLSPAAAEQIRLNSAKNDLTRLDQRVGEVSFTFVLPKTATNARLLGFTAEQLTPKKFVRSREVRVRVVADGVVVTAPDTFLRVQSTSSVGYEVNLYGPGVALFETLGDKKLRELTTLRQYNFKNYIDLQELITFSRTYTDIAAPLIPRGNFYSDDDTKPLNTISEGIRLNDYVLSVYALSVLEAIFQEQGWRVEGDILNDAMWNRAVIPFTGPGRFPWPWRVMLTGDDGPEACQLTRHETSGLAYAGDQLGLLSSPMNDYDGYLGAYQYTSLGTDVYEGSNRIVMARFQCPCAGTYRIEGTFQHYYVGPGLQPTVYLAVSGGDEVARLYRLNNPSTPTTGTITYSHDVDITSDENAVIELLVTKNSGVSGGYRWIQAVFDVELLDGITELNPIQMLPDLTQRDFARAFLNLTNHDLVIAPDRRVLSLVPRAGWSPKLAANAIDLDAYLSPEFFRYSPSSLFKQIDFQYAADSGDYVAYPYVADDPVSHPRLGDETIATNSVGRNEVKTISVPFAPTGRRTYQDTTKLPSGAVVEHDLLTIASQDALQTKRSEAQWSFDATPRLVVLRDQFSKTLPIYRRHSLTADVYYGDAYFIPSSDSPSVAFPGATGVVDTRYATTIELLLNSELVTVEARLTPQLWRQLPAGQLVRVKGVYYYVNQITNYQPATNKPATVQLLRYVAPSGR